MLHKISLFFLLLAIVFSGITAYSIWRSNLPLVSPIALIETMIGNSAAVRSKKIVYGFFPYWHTKYANDLNIGSLTHFAYFAIDLNPDGTIYKINSNREQEPGWNKLNSTTTEKLLYQSKLLGQKTVITVTAMDTDLIESITGSPPNSLRAINSILDVYKKFNFDDINVDFEYVGEPSPSVRENFTAFVQSLKSACLAINRNCQIDVDIFADTATKFRLWDISKLNEIVDRFIVMTYDYYRKTSPQAGPVAPLVGKCEDLSDTDCLEYDILNHISLITKVVPSEKVILGIPFYGYQWQTASKDFLANTYPRTGGTVSYSDVQNLFLNPKVSSISAEWSEKTLSPYITFEKEDKIYQIHFENAQSLRQKIKLVNSANLGGIAIWALGYETPFQDLWQEINNLGRP